MLADPAHQAAATACAALPVCRVAGISAATSAASAVFAHLAVMLALPAGYTLCELKVSPDGCRAVVSQDEQLSAPHPAPSGDPADFRQLIDWLAAVQAIVLGQQEPPFCMSVCLPASAEDVARLGLQRRDQRTLAEQFAEPGEPPTPRVFSVTSFRIKAAAITVDIAGA